jgi:high-affinity nickel-transport protein
MDLPHDWLALACLVFTLGLKHGLDADHLAAIDGLTRFNARDNPRLARLCGALFSLGHGAVVLAIALVVAGVSQRWSVPQWMEDFGAWTSIGFLVLLGVANLASVARAGRDELVELVGLKGRWLGRLQRARHPLLIALTGTLFALSFDTMSQAALFALTATQFGGTAHALALALAFTAGMLAVDGANGLWLSRLLRRADRTACIASRVMGVAVGGLSLTVAAFGIARYVSPAISGWSEGKEAVIGVAVIVGMALCFALAIRISRAGSHAMPRKCVSHS